MIRVRGFYVLTAPLLVKSVPGQIKRRFYGVRGLFVVRTLTRQP